MKIGRQIIIGKYTLLLTYNTKDPIAGLSGEWSPHPPTSPFTGAELAIYREGRDALLADVAKSLGIKPGSGILVIET